MRFLNDCLNPLLWNCTAKLINGQVWIYSTADIDPRQELFLPYGWLYWWKRQHMLSKSLRGDCARAYPVFSQNLNSGHVKLSFAERYRNRVKRNLPNPKLSQEKKRELASASMWAHFSSPSTSLNLGAFDRTSLKDRKRRKNLRTPSLNGRESPLPYVTRSKTWKTRHTQTQGC